jgi:L-ascorbate metabolism protein UlaG (beta-lactamase superfamily)
MIIRWLGHAAFLIISQDKTRIVTDPYQTGSGLSYKPVNESADIVTKSHDHGDHNNTQAIKGGPVVLDKLGTQTIKGISVKSVQAYHDAATGAQRGSDLIFCFKVDEVNICHLGDLGHQLTPQQLAEIGTVDILLIPVGGFFTIDATEATAVTQSLHPKVIIPMHYKNAKVDFPIKGVDEFLEGKKNVRRVNSSEFEVNRGNLPLETEIVVLQPAN